MTRDQPDGAAGSDGSVDGGLTLVERMLLEAALDFYGAAQGVIDYAGPERPRLRHNAAGLDAVRQAMAALEQHVLAAAEAGASPARIAEVARMEIEMVELILRRRGATSSPAAD